MSTIPPRPRAARAFQSAARAALRLMLPLVALGALAASAKARIEQAPNSRVVLDLPAGYVASSQFSGFQNEAQGASFVIMELPAKAFPELAAGLTADKLATRGIRDVTLAKLARPDEHIYLRGRQVSPAGDFSKFIVLFKASDLAVLVTANIPTAAFTAGTVKPEEIEHALATASQTDKSNVRDLYRLAYLGPFRQAGAFVGTSKIYTLDGRMEPERKGEARATFVVAPSLDLRPVPELDKFAQGLLQTITGYSGIKAGGPEKVRIAGLDGVLIAAEAKHAAQGVPAHILQVVLAGRDGGYYRLVGIAPGADGAKLLPEFRRIAQSFSLVD